MNQRVIVGKGRPFAIDKIADDQSVLKLKRDFPRVNIVFNNRALMEKFNII